MSDMKRRASKARSKSSILSSFSIYNLSFDLWLIKIVFLWEFLAIYGQQFLAIYGEQYKAIEPQDDH